MDVVPTLADQRCLRDHAKAGANLRKPMVEFEGDVLRILAIRTRQGKGDVVKSLSEPIRRNMQSEPMISLRQPEHVLAEPNVIASLHGRRGYLASIRACGSRGRRAERDAQRVRANAVDALRRQRIAHGVSEAAVHQAVAEMRTVVS